MALYPTVESHLQSKSGRATGIRIRHQRNCAIETGGRRCSCQPRWEGSVGAGTSGKKARRVFATEAAAKAWRATHLNDVARGRVLAITPMTLRQAAEELLTGMRDGSIVNRSGDRFKPSVIRSYDDSLKLHVLPDLGARKLSDITGADLQRLVERLRKKRNPRNEKPLAASTVRNAIAPLRVVFRRALLLDLVVASPTAGLALPAARGRRDRVAEPGEMAQLLAALPAGQRAVWATAAYAGLRRGELMALRWAEIDLDALEIRVERSWDVREGPVEPKSIAGTRVVPVAATLAAVLRDHRAATAWREGLVFGRSPGQPFNPGTVQQRARAAWSEANVGALTLHEARHTFASLMIAAGVTPKALQTYMGHGSVAITLDRYGHLFPSDRGRDAAALDALLARADTSTRVAQLDS